MPIDGPRQPADGGRQGRSTIRHLAGFVVSGLIAFSVDAVVLMAGMQLLGLDPRVARIAAISMAMVCGWLAHRRLTFALTSRATLAELGRYAAAAWATAVLNYGVFAGVVSLAPAVPTLGALVLSTLVAMVFSYVSMRYGVFRSAVDGS